MIHDEAGRAAALMARVTALSALISGMNADNNACAMRGEFPKWNYDDFTRELSNSGCHENGIIDLLVHGNL